MLCRLDVMTMVQLPCISDNEYILNHGPLRSVIYVSPNMSMDSRLALAKEFLSQTGSQPFVVIDEIKGDCICQIWTIVLEHFSRHNRNHSLSRTDTLKKVEEIYDAYYNTNNIKDLPKEIQDTLDILQSYLTSDLHSFPIFPTIIYLAGIRRFAYHRLRNLAVKLNVRIIVVCTYSSQSIYAENISPDAIVYCLDKYFHASQRSFALMKKALLHLTTNSYSLEFINHIIRHRMTIVVTFRKQLPFLSILPWKTDHSTLNGPVNEDNKKQDDEDEKCQYATSELVSICTTCQRKLMNHSGYILARLNYLENLSTSSCKSFTTHLLRNVSFSTCQVEMQNMILLSSHLPISLCSIVNDYYIIPIRLMEFCEMKNYYFIFHVRLNGRTMRIISTSNEISSLVYRYIYRTIGDEICVWIKW